MRRTGNICTVRLLCRGSPRRKEQQVPPTGNAGLDELLRLVTGVFVQSSLILGVLGLVSGIVLTALTLRRRHQFGARMTPAPPTDDLSADVPVGRSPPRHPS
jgi:hypothetical protein